MLHVSRSACARRSARNQNRATGRGSRARLAACSAEAARPLRPASGRRRCGTGQGRRGSSRRNLADRPGALPPRVTNRRRRSLYLRRRSPRRRSRTACDFRPSPPRASRSPWLLVPARRTAADAPATLAIGGSRHRVRRRRTSRRCRSGCARPPSTRQGARAQVPTRACAASSRRSPRKASRARELTTTGDHPRAAAGEQAKVLFVASNSVERPPDGRREGRPGDRRRHQAGADEIDGPSFSFSDPSTGTCRGDPRRARRRPQACRRRGRRVGMHVTGISLGRHRSRSGPPVGDRAPRRCQATSPALHRATRRPQVYAGRQEVTVDGRGVYTIARDSRAPGVTSACAGRVGRTSTAGRRRRRGIVTRVPIVAIDARDAFAPQLRGWGRYAKELIAALPERAGLDYRFLSGGGPRPGGALRAGRAAGAPAAR